MRLKDEIRARWNREGLKPGKAGWVDPKRENRLGFRTYKDNDTGEIIATQAVDQGAKEIGAQYLKDDPFGESIVSGVVLKREGVVEKARRRLRPAPPRGPAKGKKGLSITAEEIVESVTRHKAITRNLTDALNGAADELGKTGSREYKDLHRWFKDAERALNKKSA